MIILLLFVLMIPCKAFAQKYEKVDENSAMYVPEKTKIDINDIVKEIGYLQDQINRCSSQYQPRLDILQSQIDSLADSGVSNAIPLSSSYSPDTDNLDSNHSNVTW